MLFTKIMWFFVFTHYKQNLAMNSNFSAKDTFYAVSKTLLLPILF